MFATIIKMVISVLQALPVRPELCETVGVDVLESATAGQYVLAIPLFCVTP